MYGLILASAITTPVLASTTIDAHADTIYVSQDDSTKKMIESSQLRVWMQQGGRYGLQLKSNGAFIFFGQDSAYIYITRGEPFPTTGIPSNFQNLAIKSFTVSSNGIEQIRTDGTFDYVFRLSIINATTMGAYMKAEIEMRNLTPYPAVAGASFNIDTMVNGNDQSPFRIIPNGWDAFNNGVQVTAYYRDVFNVTNADAIYLGHYAQQYPMPIGSFYNGQEIYPGDSGAGFYYNPKSIPAYSSRKESWIMGMGPKNSPPSFVMSAPADNQTLYLGQTLPISGTVRDTDVGDRLQVKWAIDGGAENILTTMTANGIDQPFNYNYTLPSNLSEGWHTLQVWVMDDKGGVSSANTRRFYVNTFVTPGAPTFSNITANQLSLTFDKKSNVASTVYEVHRADNNSTTQLGTGNTLTQTGLSPNTLYQFKVRAKNTSNVYTDYSPTSSIYTLANQPTVGSLDSTVNGQVSLYWGANLNPSHTTYHYEVRRVSDNVAVKSGDTTATSAIVTGIPTNTAYNVYVKAVNGNQKGTAETLLGQFYQDTIAPTVTISQSTTAWINGDVTLTLQATDDKSGIRSIELPNGNILTNANSASFVVTQNGNYTFKVTDNSGNVTSKTITISNIDKTAPSINLTPNPASWTNKDVQINASATDVGSGVKRIQLPNGNWVNGNSTSYSVAKNGLYEFVVEDNVGHVTKRTINVSNIDKDVPNAPNLEINGIENYWVNQDVIATITDNGDEGGSGYHIEYSLSGAITEDWRTYISPVKVTKDGITTIYARVVDNAGNISPVVSKTMKIDQNAPELTITPNIKLLTNTDVILNVKAVDVATGVKRIQLPNGNWVNSDETNYTVSENGTYTFKAEDNFGHIRTVHYVVSNIKKNVLITPIREVDVEHHADDALSGVAEMQFRNEDGAWSTWEAYNANKKAWVLSPVDGLKHVWVRFKDKVGNISDPIEDIIILDMTKPIATFLEINDDDTYTKSRNVKLNLKGTDALTGVQDMYLSNDNVNWTKLPYDENPDWILSEGEGIKTVYLKVSDKAGNISDIITDTIFMDTVKPLANILINNGDVFTPTRDVMLTLTYSDIGGSGVDKVKIIEGDREYTLPAPTPNSPVTIPWTLDFGVVRTVSIVVTDKAGNISNIVSDTIIVDKLTVQQFTLENVVNPLVFNKNNPFEPKVWAFEPQDMIAGGDITFSMDIKQAVEEGYVDDSVTYKVEVVGDSYHQAFTGEMRKAKNHYTQTITIPKDTPTGAKVFITATAKRVLNVSPYDTQIVYFPGGEDASQKALVGIVKGNIYDSIRFNETK